MTTYSATITTWRAYATARGDSAPGSATDATAEAALLRGADYIRTRYVIRMATGTDTSDARITEAIHIAASQELATPGFWSKTYTPSEAKVLTEVKGIKWTPITGMGTGVDAMRPVSPAIDALLFPLMVPAAAFVV